MNHVFEETLIREIQALETFFQDVPAHICHFYGLDEGVPLDIKFGPDIESYFVKNGRNIFTQPATLKRLGLSTMDDIDHNFLLPIRYKLQQAGIIGGAYEDCAMDGNVVETRFKPANPLLQGTHYKTYCDILTRAAQDWQLDVFAGEGHWHFSVMQKQVSCLDVMGGYLRDQVAAHIVAMQKIYPAFFVKPYIAERSHDVGYAGPQDFEVCEYDEVDHWKRSVRHKDHGLGCSTIEPRLNLYAPYQPVYLNLLALQSGLLNQNPYDQKMVTKHKNDILRGQGGYLSMLEQTACNLKSQSLFDKALGIMMFQVAVNGYVDYLQSGFQEIKMPDRTIAWLVAQAQDLVVDLQKDPKMPQKSALPAFQI